MTDKIEQGDFIEVNYTGKLGDGTIFDTTDEKVAKDSGIFQDDRKFIPANICVGQNQVIPGLDQDFIDKEISKDYSVNIPAELAFGKRDIKKIKIVPSSTFKEHKVTPQKGMQVDVDGEVGTVSSVSGGRIIVNFNHPLAGRDVSYSFTIKRKINDQKEQISTFLNTTLRVPDENIKVQIKEEKANIELPLQLPPQFTDALGKKLSELTKLKEIKFTTSQKAPSSHEHGPNCKH
jgi:FKBP-type peptidyl-prolyl cis-trans isomerase SlyD